VDGGGGYQKIGEKRVNNLSLEKKEKRITGKKETAHLACQGLRSAEKRKKTTTSSIKIGKGEG